MGWLPALGLVAVLVSGLTLIASWVRAELRLMRRHGIPMPWDDD